VRALAARGRHRIAVASCFAAPGRFAVQCAAAAPGVAAAPLGDHPALARLVLLRYDQVLAASEGHEAYDTSPAFETSEAFEPVGALSHPPLAVP
jgi:sirohydrochlorin ferrochelatase